MKKIIPGLLIGALCGLLLGTCLGLILGCDSICSCSSAWMDAFWCGGDLSDCGRGCSMVIADPAVHNCMIFGAIIGGAIGAAYGYSTARQENRDKAAAEREARERRALARRQENASMVQGESRKAVKEIRQIKKKSDGLEISPAYGACAQQKSCWESINFALGTNQRLREAAEALEQKDGEERS